MKHPLPERLRGLTQALFYEYRHISKCDHPPVYTLKEYDWEGCKSMYQIYMSCDSEYDAALTLLGSWKHWCRLKSTSWFKEYYEAWEEERAIRDQASATTTLLKRAEEGDTSAAKAVLSHYKEAAKKGRPSKKTQHSGMSPTKERTFNAALQRLNVVNGGKGEK